MSSPSEFRFLSLATVSALHRTLLSWEGGADGLREPGLLDSAVARVRNVYACGETRICALAAWYAIAICRNHPFVDGNRRTILAAMDVFLRLHGSRLAADKLELTTVMLDLATGTRDDAAFVDWVCNHIADRPAAR